MWSCTGEITSRADKSMESSVFFRSDALHLFQKNQPNIRFSTQLSLLWTLFHSLHPQRLTPSGRIKKLLLKRHGFSIYDTAFNQCFYPLLHAASTAYRGHTVYRELCLYTKSIIPGESFSLASLYITMAIAGGCMIPWKKAISNLSSLLMGTQCT